MLLAQKAHTGTWGNQGNGTYINPVLNADYSDTGNLTSYQITSLQVLGQVWGFLKYYHPNVAKGQLNWDSVLIAKVPVFLSAGNARHLNEIVLTWLNELGKVDSCMQCDNTLTGRINYNFDTVWLTHSVFNTSIVSKLQHILANRSQGENYYVTYGKSRQIKIKNEELYSSPGFQYPSPAYRLLTLFRYWNIVNYFSPYKYITSKKWETVLAEYIPQFCQAKDELEYQLSIIKIIRELEDGHCVFNGLGWSPKVSHLLGSFTHLPFLCTIVEGKAVVAFITNDSLCKAQGIALNDVIVSIDGETIEERINKLWPYIVAASNEEGRLFALCSSYLFAGNTNTCTLTRLTPQGSTNQVVIKRSNTSLPYAPPVPVTWKMLANNIGYINMSDLLVKDVEKIMDSLAATRGIIIDIRNHPNDTWPAIAARLSSHKFIAPRLIYPDLSFPGFYKYYDDWIAGKEQDAPYSGKVVLLVNEYTKSHGEYSAMALQGATKTITIGSTTAGADGDVTDWFALPGRFNTRFSGLGVYYPDGTVAQKKGVRINIVCKPTIKGLQQGRDELIETAIKVINGQ